MLGESGEDNNNNNNNPILAVARSPRPSVQKCWLQVSRPPLRRGLVSATEPVLHLPVCFLHSRDPHPNCGIPWVTEPPSTNHCGRQEMYASRKPSKYGYIDSAEEHTHLQTHSLASPILEKRRSNEAHTEL